MTTGYTAILEDNEARREQMRLCMATIAPRLTTIIFDSAYQMIAWLENNQHAVDILSLDYDLPIHRTSDNEVVDYGTGGQVAEFLSGRPPTCPVVIHSSNDAGASQMMQLLKPAGWPVVRVYPFDDTRWIANDWAVQVKRCLEGTSGHTNAVL